jgi:hypothetical protein
MSISIEEAGFVFVFFFFIFDKFVTRLLSHESHHLHNKVATIFAENERTSPQYVPATDVFYFRFRHGTCCFVCLYYRMIDSGWLESTKGVQLGEGAARAIIFRHLNGFIFGFSLHVGESFGPE